MSWDYVIVGAGTAGCVLANRLSANRQVRVLLLEAGGRDGYFWIDIPVGYLFTIGGAFACSDSSRAHANIEWHVQPLSLDRFGEPLHPFDAITPSVCNLQPTSRGHVRAKEPDPEAAPAIQPNYLATEDDHRVAIDSLRFTRRIMAAQPLARFRPEELLPGPRYRSDGDLLEAASEIGTTIFHPVGTCRMGVDSDAVVNDRLEVNGVAGLRVIDASIMPRITSGNTNAPTVMIAEKGAEFVLEDHARRP